MSLCTIVVPCFNETARLDLRAFVEHAARHDHQFLFVNDGSTDQTGELLEDFCASWPEMLAVLQLKKNVGKAEAVRLGVLAAGKKNGSLIGYWDADLATPLEAICDMETYLRDHPAVELLLGSRVQLLGRQIERKLSRHLLGRVFATVASNVLQLPVYDTQCGAKLFRNSATMQAAFDEPFTTRWIFDVELLARLLVAGNAGDQSADEPARDIVDRIHEFPLAAWRDVAGSKLKSLDFVKAAWQLGMIYRRYPGLRTARLTASRRRSRIPTVHSIATSIAGSPSSQPRLTPAARR